MELTFREKLKCMAAAAAVLLYHLSAFLLNQKGVAGHLAHPFDVCLIQEIPDIF